MSERLSSMLEKLIEEAERARVTEFEAAEVERGKSGSYYLRFKFAGRDQVSQPKNRPVRSSEQEKPAEEESKDWHRIKAPYDSVYHRSAEENGEPLVEVGDRVQEGQEVGVLEAMKNFTPLKTEVPGTVSKILVVGDHVFVREGDTIMILDTSAKP